MSDDERILDEWIVTCCRLGETELLALLVKRWHPRLLRCARRVTGDAEGAAEVVQEAWVVIVRRIGSLRSPAAFPAWALGITRRRAIDWVRRRGRDRIRHGSAGDRAGSDRLARDDAVGSLDGAADRDRLREAIDALPEAQREVLALYYVDELGVEEIARVLGVRRGTVQSRLFRARADLRGVLTDSDGDPDGERDEDPAGSGNRTSTHTTS